MFPICGDWRSRLKRKPMKERESIFGRGARIRTGDLLRPRQARYQAAPRPDKGRHDWRVTSARRQARCDGATYSAAECLCSILPRRRDSVQCVSAPVLCRRDQERFGRHGATRNDRLGVRGSNPGTISTVYYVQPGTTSSTGSSTGHYVARIYHHGRGPGSGGRTKGQGVPSGTWVASGMGMHTLLTLTSCRVSEKSEKE
jgi:hypothetical protein